MSNRSSWREKVAAAEESLRTIAAVCEETRPMAEELEGSISNVKKSTAEMLLKLRQVLKEMEAEQESKEAEQTSVAQPRNEEEDRG